ncbi:MAG: heme o synthase [Phycisphaerales bacterium]|nr:heme o synthase [Phycisphaerales bacterium]
MTTLSSSISTPASGEFSPRVYLELAKARLCALVLVTTAIGFLLAPLAQFDLMRFAWTLIGVTLAAFGANALNQCVEISRDARMPRTARRPLPSRQLTPAAAWSFAICCATVGPLVLWLTIGVLPAALALATVLLYIVIYTPMKSLTPLNTLVGAICGAIPPMIGWVAATGDLSAPAWILGAILFLWQMPHFFALAWMYREDYRLGGFRMLPYCDPGGRLTTIMIIAYSLALAPVSLATVAVGVNGPLYALGATALGVWFSSLGWRMRRDRSNAAARRVFIASVIYLPALLGLMLADHHLTPIVVAWF